MIATVLLAAGLGILAIRHLGTLGKPLLVVHGKIVQRSHGTALLVMVAAVVLIWVSKGHVWTGLSEGLWWRGLAAWFALASIPVAATFIFKRPCDQSDPGVEGGTQEGSRVGRVDGLATEVHAWA